MKKNISFYNVYSFLYLWNNRDGKKYITNLLNNILNENNKYTIIPLISQNSIFLRSYLLFETNNKTILLDFNYFPSLRLLGCDKDIISFNRYLNNKDNILIILNSFWGNSFYYSNFKVKLYNIYANNIYVSLKIKRYLNKMDDKCLDKYYNEILIHKRINDK